MRLGTPRSEQGQIIERSYGWHDDDYYMREYDGSDGSVQWYRADSESADRLAMTTYEAGGDNYPPAVDEWIPCAAPKEDLP